MVFINITKYTFLLDAKIRETILHNIVHFGLRLVLGASFIVIGPRRISFSDIAKNPRILH